jgi:putative methionine-R-sulfoxide reductase with GAF domain
MRDKSELFDWLTSSVGEILKSALARDDKLKAICKMLSDGVPHYDWVGFYIVDKKRPNELVLGPFEGEPTEHVRILLEGAYAVKRHRSEEHSWCKTFHRRRTTSHVTQT